ncbi:unnamed protein product [Phytophthora fragariaefolia]|uniref:Unnamed protein product n=1 Tax=Phytophthora fragariaefolia TaxID=1490495 RepID=A0A9W6XK54_9STRA|nr:unnamed protein product [Phytophthora fragariaefolia]
MCSPATILQAKEAELCQLHAVKNAREAELLAKVAELNRCMAEVVVEGQRDPASADISAKTKPSVERSVKPKIDLIRGAVDRYVLTMEEDKAEIENRGSISENDEDGANDDVAEEDRSAQQRMRDALVRAQATHIPPIHSLCQFVLCHLNAFGAVAAVAATVEVALARTALRIVKRSSLVPAGSGGESWGCRSAVQAEFLTAFDFDGKRGANSAWRCSNMDMTTFEYDHEGNKIGDVGGGKADDYCIELTRA